MTSMMLTNAMMAAAVLNAQKVMKNPGLAHAEARANGYELTDKTLYQVCRDVEPGEDVTGLAQAMLAIMHKNKGIGLAANQIGDDRRVIVMHCEGFWNLVLINPVITKRSENVTGSKEGCLSFQPTWSNQVTIQRHKIVTVEATTLDGKPFKQKFRGLPGFCVQHEIDHLNGITIFGEDGPPGKTKDPMDGKWKDSSGTAQWKEKP